MNYEIIEIDTLSGKQQHVIIDRNDGSFESFHVDPENPRYQQWLKENEEPQTIDDSV